jgi:hypothetical protein
MDAMDLWVNTELLLFISKIIVALTKLTSCKISYYFLASVINNCEVCLAGIRDSVEPYRYSTLPVAMTPVKHPLVELQNHRKPPEVIQSWYEPV